MKMSRWKKYNVAETQDDYGNFPHAARINFKHHSRFGNHNRNFVYLPGDNLMRFCDL